MKTPYIAYNQINHITHALIDTICWGKNAYQLGRIPALVAFLAVFFENFTKNRKTYLLGAYQGA